MGAVTASQRQNDGDNILQHFAADMLSALLEQLESRGRGMRRLISAIFMLNNCEFPTLAQSLYATDHSL